MSIKAGLFGIENSNRDFSKKESWGKNQFNSSFPAALCCYMASKGISSNWISLESGKINVSQIKIEEIFGFDPNSKEIFYAFESPFSPYAKYVIGSLPRTDLVTQEKASGRCLNALEIKLTALPDNSTCELSHSEYGCELVIRPDTICYLACILASDCSSGLASLFKKEFKGIKWSSSKSVVQILPEITLILKEAAKKSEENQKPFLLQPVWKTNGKSSELAENCLDVFTWSSSAFFYFITEIAECENDGDNINRQTRTLVWLYLLLLDIFKRSKANFESIVDQIAFNTKNDKAFAVSGLITNKIMRSPRLERPAIKKAEIKNIILGGGQKLLSPERRFDAILALNSDIFE